MLFFIFSINLNPFINCFLFLDMMWYPFYRHTLFNRFAHSAGPYCLPMTWDLADIGWFKKGYWMISHYLVFSTLYPSSDLHCFDSLGWGMILMSSARDESKWLINKQEYLMIDWRLFLKSRKHWFLLRLVLRSKISVFLDEQLLLLSEGF